MFLFQPVCANRGRSITNRVGRRDVSEMGFYCLQYHCLPTALVSFCVSGHSDPLPPIPLFHPFLCPPRITTEVSSGSCVVNDCLYQFANLYAPFGGVGESGMGGYHGACWSSVIMRPAAGALVILVGPGLLVSFQGPFLHCKCANANRIDLETLRRGIYCTACP
jgi:hypothetical protein